MCEICQSYSSVESNKFIAKNKKKLSLAWAAMRPVIEQQYCTSDRGKATVLFINSLLTKFSESESLDQREWEKKCKPCSPPDRKNYCKNQKDILQKNIPFMQIEKSILHYDNMAALLQFLQLNATHEMITNFSPTINIIMKAWCWHVCEEMEQSRFLI